MRYIYLYMYFFARITNARLKRSYHFTGGGEFEQTPYIEHITHPEYPGQTGIIFKLDHLPRW